MIVSWEKMIAILVCLALAQGCRDSSSGPGAGSSEPLFVKELDFGASAGIILEGNYVYFQTNDGPNIGKLYRISKDGQETTIFASGGQSFGVPTILSNSIVTTSTTGGIRVFEKSTGQLRWSRLARDLLVLATADEATVYVTEPGSIRALSLADGTTRWEKTIIGKNAYNPVLEGERIYFATGALHRQDGYLYCINKNDGAIVFQDTLPYMESRSQWGGSAAGVTIWEDFVLVPGDNWYLYCFEKSEGAFVWQFLADAPMETPVRVKNGIAFIGTLNRTCFGVDTQTGSALWAYVSEASIKRIPPSFHGSRVSFASGGSLIVLDQVTGSKYVEYSPRNTKFSFVTAIFDSDGKLFCTGYEEATQKPVFMVYQF